VLDGDVAYRDVVATGLHHLWRIDGGTVGGR
jgi:hypothetical protein